MAPPGNNRQGITLKRLVRQASHVKYPTSSIYRVTTRAAQHTRQEEMGLSS